MNFSKFGPRLVSMFLGPFIAFVVSGTSAVFAADADALYLAAGSGDSQQVAALLDSGVSVNARSSDGSYALNNAAVENHIGILSLLLDRGADPNVQNSQGDTPLICATKYAGGREETVKILIEAGTNLEIRDQEGKTALDYAEAKQQDEAVALLESSSGK